MSSEVYFSSMKTKRGDSLLTKLENLIVRAGLLEAIASKDLLAISTGLFSFPMVRRLVWEADSISLLRSDKLCKSKYLRFHRKSYGVICYNGNKIG